MNIIVFTGSNHSKGTSSLLADKFIEGAQCSGHNVIRVDAGREKINPCIGCYHCRSAKHLNDCVYKDVMTKHHHDLILADVVVFVTPLYFYGMSAQLKAVIDRFYAVDNQLKNAPKKAVLMFTAEDDSPNTGDALVNHYHEICNYLGWKDAGIIKAIKCAVRDDIEKTEYPHDAYTLGLHI